MQSLIPFLETLMPTHQKVLYNSLIDELEELGSGNTQQILEIAQNNLLLIRKTIGRLKTETLSTSFETQEAEILFFKITKPHFHGLLFYWTEIFDLELHRPLGGIKAEEKYLKKYLRQLSWFFNKHAEFYAYYRSGKKFLDEQYFILKQELSSTSTFTHDFEIDPLYSTKKDWLVAKILGFERMQFYVEHAIESLHQPHFKNAPVGKKVEGLQWTASKANMVELIYALHSAGVYNNGNADIKSIARNFEQVFHVELGNFYNVFNELRLKKTSRTQLLDTLREKVTRKMDELDEK